MGINNISIKNVDDENGKVKAYVSFVIDNCFAVHNARIIDGKNGLFVAMPSKKTDQGFVDVCHPINKEFREIINKEIIENYKISIVNE
ncbi:MAG: SpoVG family protein [Bacilli bacterium]